MTEVLNRAKRDVLLISVLLLVVTLSAGVGTVGAQSAPDCSTVTYNGDGTTSNPYEVGSVDQLQCIEEQDLGANYVQVSDIDGSGTSMWNDGDGFDPIGDDNNRFTGAFDGMDHTVSGLYIDTGNTNDVGLFGGVDSSTQLNNVSLKNVDINGDDFVGGLVGRNFGTVTNSYVSGTVSGTESSVGGLVGRNGGTVTESYATADVSGNEEVGGLVGRNSGGTVEKSYATGDVSAPNVRVGGLVGTNIGTVEKSYATGDISGTGGVGGLVGQNANTLGVGTIRESYATGDVSADDFVGGLVGPSGVETEGTVTESYWNEETTGHPTSGGGTGLITSEMTGSAATSNMQGFDFTGTWETVSGDYPILAWQKPTPSFTLSTTPPPVGEAITFDGSNSGDRDGSIQTYEWDFDGDGNTDVTREGPLATHTYSSPGTFAVTLTVTDDDGATATTTQTVSVGEGMPGFTAVTALLAVLTVLRRRSDEGGSRLFDGSP
jgi:hypothetical protein